MAGWMAVRRKCPLNRSVSAMLINAAWQPAHYGSEIKTQSTNPTATKPIKNKNKFAESITDE